MLFSPFLAVGASQAREFQIAMTTTPRKIVQTTFSAVTYICSPPNPPNPVFFECVCMILQWFPSKRSNLHICCHKAVPGLKTSSFTWFPIPLSPQTLENTAIYNVFFNFSMFQCRCPIQTYIQEILPKQGSSFCPSEGNDAVHRSHLQSDWCLRGDTSECCY